MNQDIPRKLPAAQGLQWINAGFRLYRKNPLLLSAAFGVAFGVVMALGLIPGLGGALSDLAWPLAVAGFMAVYRALDEDQELELPQFLSGLQPVALSLMTIGAIQLLAMLVIGKVMLGMGFDPQAIMDTAKRGDASPQEMQALINQSMPAVMTGLLLFTPLMMATWFAPALVLFGGARPLTALGISLKAVLRNWTAMLLNGLALGLLLFVAALVPFMLGLLVAMPILLASLYASYQAIFAVWADETPSSDQAADNLA